MRLLLLGMLQLPQLLLLLLDLLKLKLLLLLFLGMLLLPQLLQLKLLKLLMAPSCSLLLQLRLQDDELRGSGVAASGKQARASVACAIPWWLEWPHRNVPSQSCSWSCCLVTPRYFDLKLPQQQRYWFVAETVPQARPFLVKQVHKSKHHSIFL
jgi:hypothetical protein